MSDAEFITYWRNHKDAQSVEGMLLLIKKEVVDKLEQQLAASQQEVANLKASHESVLREVNEIEAGLKLARILSDAGESPNELLAVVYHMATREK